MKKKLLLCLLVFALLALPLLAACGEESPSPTATKTATPTPTAAEVIKLRWSCPFQEMEPPSRYGYFFCDYIEEKTGGQVVFDRFPGGVLGTVPEHLELVRSGSVDAANLIVFNYKEDMPLHTYPSMQMGSQDISDEYQYQLNIAIPEAAAILAQERADNNLILMNAAHAMGENGMIARFVFETLDDLKGKKVGVSSQQHSLQQLGLDLVSVQIPDMYEALSRGVVDLLTMALGPMAILHWHEVSECYMSQNEFASGQPIFLNLDTWNSLSPELQDIFLEAGEATMEFAAEFNAASQGEVLQIFRDAGLVVDKLNQEDTETLFRLNYEQLREQCLENCAKLGKTAEAEILLNYCDELTWGK